MKRLNPATVLLWLTVALIVLMGSINLWSSVTPALPSRLLWLQETFPIEIRHSARIFAAMSGFFLLILASSLLRRKRVAWNLTVAILCGSILSNMIKGLDIEESLFSAGLIILLLLMRNRFTAQSDLPSIAAGVKALIASLLFTLAYGSTGFFLLDRAYNKQFDLLASAVQTLAMFFTEDNAGLVPITRFSHFFADSIYLVGGSTLLFALLMLLRPVLIRGDPATPVQRSRANAIVQNHGCSSLAAFTLLDDKSYFFSRSEASFIAYVAKGKGAIVLGDPIGPDMEINSIIQDFKTFCDRNDWSPGFYQVGSRYLQNYQMLGFITLKIGEEAIVDLRSFTLQGKVSKQFRTSINKLTKLGYRMEIVEPPVPLSVLKELRSISDEWLQIVKGSEKKFSLGWFNDRYLSECQIAVIKQPDGCICAFANIVPEYQLDEISIDMMRHRKNVPHGTMDYLFISLFQYFQAHGIASFNLGLSALSGVGELQTSPRVEKIVHNLYSHLNRFYNFEGLHKYKAKFNPRWEPRYLVIPGYAALPDIVISLIRADSGDRVFDYLRPGS